MVSHRPVLLPEQSVKRFTPTACAIPSVKQWTLIQPVCTSILMMLGSTLGRRLVRDPSRARTTAGRCAKDLVRKTQTLTVVCLQPGWQIRFTGITMVQMVAPSPAEHSFQLESGQPLMMESIYLPTMFF